MAGLSLAGLALLQELQVGGCWPGTHMSPCTSAQRIPLYPKLLSQPFSPLLASGNLF